MGDPEIIRQDVRHERIWHFTARIREGSVPDMRITTRTTIRPICVHVVLMAEGGDGEPHVEKVIVSGPRVLVTGRMSEVVSRQEYSRWQWDGPDALPEWLRKYVGGVHADG